MILRENEPENLEFQFSSLNSFLTPNDQFFIRSHFPVPQLDARTWRLKVEGAVSQPFEISFDELRRLPTRSVAALLECSGNSRVFLVPKENGVRWELGAVSNGEWLGVPLVTLLERAGIKNGAVEVVFEGADIGEIKQGDIKSPGSIHFARSLPMSVARDKDVLLVYRMNGKELPPSHGFPVRLIVPGWYGMASVKWLQRIVVTEQPFRGFFQTFNYSHWEDRNGLLFLNQVTELQVKSEIARPVLRETIPAGSTYRVFGAAWAGQPEITKVEVSTDGGNQWAPARLLDKSVPNSWRLWEFPWQVPKQAGDYTLMARATDARGRTQPREHDKNHRDTMIHHILPVQVQVR